MCRLYEVTRDGFNSWRARGKSLRKHEDETLYDVIAEIFNASGGIYGSPKITEVMKGRGFRISKKRVARIMQENGLIARKARIYRRKVGLLNFIKSVPNRELKALADTPDKVWHGDITYIKVNDEWMYMAVIIDKFSRKVISWGLSSNRDTALTWQVFKQAMQLRHPKPGLIFHTDRGIEYRGFYFSERLAKRGFIQSMNRPRRMNDNARMESFFANFKAERIHGNNEIKTKEELRSVMREYVEFYNNERIHSSIDYLTPNAYESKLG